MSARDDYVLPDNARPANYRTQIEFMCGVIDRLRGDLAAITASLPLCQICDPAKCTGRADCIARVHVHGCHADSCQNDQHPCPAGCSAGRVTVAQTVAVWEAVHNTRRMFGRTEIPGAEIRFHDPDGILPYLRGVKPATADDTDPTPT